MTLSKLTDVTTETYWIQDNYLMDIQTSEIGYEAYIYNSIYGVKMLCVGIPKTQQTYEEFIDLVSYDTNIKNWISAYEQDYIAKE